MLTSSAVPLSREFSLHQCPDSERQPFWMAISGVIGWSVQMGNEGGGGVCIGVE